jgi:penicillin G amidase
MKIVRSPVLLASLWMAALLPNAQLHPSTVGEMAEQSLSQLRGTMKITGLRQPVEVLRDRWGVAHIYARNQHDLFFAQGFVAAQDRLFQMELWKRSGQGRLAEILGSSALLGDINARLLEYRGDMNSEYESYSPDTKAILTAFTDGINAYISTRLRGNQGLPLEFQVAGFKPEPWKPEDCLNRMAAFAMTGNGFSELAHAEAVAALGSNKATQLFEFDPAVELDPAPGADFSGLSPKLLRNVIGSDVRIEFPPSIFEGSNNWAVSGILTRSGKPLLANDPHRVMAEPSLRYMVHLVAPGWNVIGAGEPGLPGVAVGHNQNIAWGFTIFGLDQQDLYLEELNPADRLQYKLEHGWARMRLLKETFGIRGGPDVQVELKFTRHGPVVWEDSRRALVLHWVGTEPGTAGYLGSLAVDRARNWQEFERAMERWKVPSENIVYADQEGNIGEHSVGLAPVRKNWTGLLPLPGNGKYEWTGFLPMSELPHSFNPSTGFIATANHRMIPEGYPHKVGYQWDPGFRFRRITEVLGAARGKGKKLGMEDMEQLQNDVVSLPALAFITLLPHAGGQPEPGLQLLLDWDGGIRTDSAAAALYEIWQKDVTSEVMKRVAPENLRHLLEDASPLLVLRYLTQASGNSERLEPERTPILMSALHSAVDQLTHMQGRDPAKWSWGQLHGVRFRHPLDRLSGAEALMNLGPVERPGDGYTVNATGYPEGTYEQKWGASYREILDLSDWNNSLAINVPGQSGQPISPHYADLLPLWGEGKYFPLLYSRDFVEKASTDKLRLEP